MVDPGPSSANNTPTEYFSPPAVCHERPQSKEVMVGFIERSGAIVESVAMAIVETLKAQRSKCPLRQSPLPHRPPTRQE
jgi:hypothetical protein